MSCEAAIDLLLGPVVCARVAMSYVHGHARAINGLLLLLVEVEMVWMLVRMQIIGVETRGSLRPRSKRSHGTQRASKARAQLTIGPKHKLREASIFPLVDMRPNP